MDSSRVGGGISHKNALYDWRMMNLFLSFLYLPLLTVWRQVRGGYEERY